MSELTAEQIQQRLRGMQQSFDSAEQGGYSDPLAGIDDDDYQTRLESFEIFPGKKNPNAIYIKTFFSIQHHVEHAGRELTTFHDMTLALVIEGPFAKRPGYFKSRVVTRVWWLWFALKVVHVPEHEYATTAWDWRYS